jgi:hypothetical protein
MSDGAEVGDVVTVRDEDRSRDDGPWEVTKIEDGTAELETVYQPYRYEPVADLNVVEEGGHEP